MKIPGDDSIRLLETVLFGVKKTGQEGSVRSSEKSEEVSSSDRVEISGAAKEFQELSRQIASLPETRAEKVAALQQKIEAGAYHPAGEAVAEKLVRSTLLDAIF